MNHPLWHPWVPPWRPCVIPPGVHASSPPASMCALPGVHVSPLLRPRHPKRPCVTLSASICRPLVSMRQPFMCATFICLHVPTAAFSSRQTRRGTDKRGEERAKDTRRQRDCEGVKAFGVVPMVYDYSGLIPGTIQVLTPGIIHLFRTDPRNNTIIPD